MHFVPANMSARPGSSLAIAEAVVRYEVRSINGDHLRTLDSDPTVAPPLPVFRLTVNAIATFAMIIFAGLVVVAAAPAFFGFGSVVVTSGSMEPAIKIADVVVTSPSDGVDLAEGAVINFDRDEGTVLHRIAAVTPEGYRTSGDANRTADSDLVSPSQVRGVGIVVVPFIGHPAAWAEGRQWGRLFVALIVLVGAMYFSRTRWIEPESDWKYR